MSAGRYLKDNLASPVVSLVVLQERRPGIVLFGVRTPTATSDRHPNVLSSPTMRVPSEVMRAALEAERIDPWSVQHGEIRALHGHADYPFGVAHSMTSPVAFLAEHLLARKLGVAEVLVNGRLNGTVCAGGISFDTVHDSESEPQDESTLMLSLTVRIAAGEDLFPERTESYSRLAWVETDQVHEAVRTHDPLRLIADLDPLAVCLHGLCVRSAAEVINAGPVASLKPSDRIVTP